MDRNRSPLYLYEELQFLYIFIISLILKWSKSLKLILISFPEVILSNFYNLYVRPAVRHAISS